jgi:crotonobetainyl-CoA:carnitine CoA-transferase CaiB-like acyl-CoA transferase
MTSDAKAPIAVTEEGSMQRLLEGIRVVEVAIYGFVPSAAAALSDWGADVVKIEHPETGDPIRGLASYGINPGAGGVTALWEVLNRGKRSVGIDIRKPEGLELLMSLVDESDVFLTNFMPSACTRLGIDAKKIIARNPRIIYGRGTGHGPIGPDADKGGFDALSYWSRSGAATAAMSPDSDFPVLLPGPAFGDIQTGMHLAGGIVAALYRREKTGQGGVVDVSLLGSGLWAMQASIAGAYAIRSDNILQLDRRRPQNPIANIYRTADGRFFVLGMLEADRYWPGLCKALGKPGLESDPRFANMVLRAQNREACVKILDEIFGTMTLAQVTETLERQEGPWTAVGFPRDAVTDEQALVNGYIQFVEYEGGAKLPLVPIPVQLDGEPIKLARAPAHGEHTDEVLAARGRSSEELIRLKVTGVIA